MPAHSLKVLFMKENRKKVMFVCHMFFFLLWILIIEK